MKLLTNPVILRMAVVFIAAAVAFVIAFVAIRQLRRGIQADAALADGAPSSEGFPLHTYHAVIQQLKQQKHELQALQQAERRRAKASENISAAVLSNLTSGVLVFNSTGLIRQANPAAKNILGFASPVGMNANDLFRDATVRGGLNSERTPLAEAVAASLKTLSKFHHLEADYFTPGREQRVLEITISPVYGAHAEILGAACLVTDQTEIARMRGAAHVDSSAPAELRAVVEKSLQVIAEQARDLAANATPEATERIAADIASETERLRAALSPVLSHGNAMGAALGSN